MLNFLLIKKFVILDYWNVIKRVNQERNITIQNGVLSWFKLEYQQYKYASANAEDYNEIGMNHPEEQNHTITIKVEADDHDCIESGLAKSNYTRKPPCSYSPNFPRFGGRPWYWVNNIKPQSWDLFYNITKKFLWMLMMLLIITAFSATQIIY
ncbi:hypothetical protein PV327_009812 [Microctonus hyperodae]|uniref:Uncharacterized protein n=1 Tax=Microctonus hyperodae TaxID=165561 RepID=A0AA39F1R4_MICHY|nr:hypothetical protein PV327_009812 [Microctonus hyperodae]